MNDLPAWLMLFSKKFPSSDQIGRGAIFSYILAYLAAEMMLNWDQSATRIHSLGATYDPIKILNCLGFQVSRPRYEYKTLCTGGFQFYLLTTRGSGKCAYKSDL